MHDFSRLEAAIIDELRNGIGQLREANDSLALVACGMVEDLTGFFIAGADAGYLLNLEGDEEDIAEFAWFPSEWPLWPEEPEGLDEVTAALGELAGVGSEEEISDDEYTKLRESYEQLIIESLQKLRASGELKNSRGQQIWVWLNSSDDSDYELDVRSFAALQDPELTAEFRTRFEGGTKALLNRIDTVFNQ